MATRWDDMNPYFCTDNKIGVEGTRYLAEVLKINSGLTSLDFSCKRNKSIVRGPLDGMT